VTPNARPEQYWRAFSSNRIEISGATVLENRQLPILEVNAGYPTAPGQILAIKPFYEVRGRPAILILPEGTSLELEASNAQFVPHARFAVLEYEPELEPDWNRLPVVEQVSWGAARNLAKTWCDFVGAKGWEVSISSEIARLMPNTPKVLAYVALKKDLVIGMGLSLEGAVHWLAGERPAKTAIVKRAAFDSGTALQFSVPLEHLSEFATMRLCQRYVIWTEASRS
jgi:hypothetical protein